MTLDPRLSALLSEIRQASLRVLVLTGAGISAESGIPTFRGRGGYWVLGSQNYAPQEMATRAMFCAHPEEVWRWYTDRFHVVRKAEPNAAHRALVELERALCDRFTLVTQNIDGLHRRAGSSEARTFAIHGDAAFVRCADECGVGRLPHPDVAWSAGGTSLSPEARKALTCPGCGGWLRPHVLWFDECYDEENYRFESSLNAARQADLLVSVGTTGTTNLPSQIGALCLARGIAIVDVNTVGGYFADLAERSPRGFAARGPAATLVPEIVHALLEAPLTP